MRRVVIALEYLLQDGNILEFIVSRHIPIYSTFQSSDKSLSKAAFYLLGVNAVHFYVFANRFEVDNYRTLCLGQHRA